MTYLSRWLNLIALFLVLIQKINGDGNDSNTNYCDPDSRKNDCTYGCCKNNNQYACCTEEQYNRAVTAALFSVFIVILITCFCCCLLAGTIYGIMAHFNRKKQNAHRQSVYFNATQAPVPLSTSPSEYNSTATNPTDIGFVVIDNKPESMPSVYNTSFLVPEGTAAAAAATNNQNERSNQNQNEETPPSYALIQM